MENTSPLLIIVNFENIKNNQFKSSHSLLTHQIILIWALPPTHTQKFISGKHENMFQIKTIFKISIMVWK